MTEESSRVGSTLGPYRVDALIGRGGMGEVYQAYDTVKDRTVALKLLSPHLVDNEEFRSRFMTESRTAARLSEPHIIPIHDFGEIDGLLFIDMRLVEGQDLRTILKKGPIPPARAANIVGQIANALDAAHKHGLVHRDVKPDNILIDENDFAYLVDFGIAHGMGDTSMTMAGTALGSLAYMAPERFGDEQAGPAADTYSLACVLYESLTGRQPFVGSSTESLITAHLTKQPPMTGIALDPVIAYGMGKDPASRYGSTKEFARAISRALATMPPVAQNSVITPPRPHTGPPQSGGFAQSGPPRQTGWPTSGPPQQAPIRQVFPGAGAVGPQGSSGPQFASGPGPSAQSGATQSGPAQSGPAQSGSTQSGSGQSGPFGQSGSSGPQFASGPLGRQSGPHGASGPQGFYGSSGPQATSGPQGSGPQATSGPQFASDPQRFGSGPQAQPGPGGFGPPTGGTGAPAYFTGAPNNSGAQGLPPKPKGTNTRKIAIIASVALLVIVLGTVGIIVATSGGSDPTPPTSTGPSSSTIAGSTVACTYRSVPAKGPTSPQPPTQQPNTGTTLIDIDTSQGQLNLTLNHAMAPCNAGAVVSLAKNGYYDNTTCHRLSSDGTLLICGDPTGTQAGSPGWANIDEFPKNLTASGGNDSKGRALVTYPRGTVALVNSDPTERSNASNGTAAGTLIFFMKPANIAPIYSVVGTIDDASLTILDRVATGGITPDKGTTEYGRPNTPVVISTATVK
ncbi:protein kinase [Gordonia sp. TBRC 11910]|uniref:non-specific serine/threonine protein kinase n=1 Tax=Gordonia asplenii TaxID=2725283 RepID=A0A848KWF6_9ACTN|nr:protein kinase [Gordonia asplenii]NMO01205.1 protein kinase [Gordonia asplenii]